MVKLISVLAVFIYSVFANSPPNSLQERIIDGKPATSHVPYIVSLSIKSFNGHNCGGAILNKNWILTAAHCVVQEILENGRLILRKVSPNSIKIRAGNNTLRGQTNVYGVKKIIGHFRYSRRPLKNDIALLKVASPIKLDNNKIASIPIDEAPVKMGENVVICGWGYISVLKKLPKDLQCLDQTVTSTEKCFSYVTLYDKYICASNPKDSAAFSGDSGSPLVRNNKLVGVFSFYTSEDPAGEPSGYTRITSFASWIIKTMNTN